MNFIKKWKHVKKNNNMVEEIFNAALSSGLFAVLFTFLLFYILKDSSKR